MEEYDELPPLLSPLRLAKFLDVSTRTLERWRNENRGPLPRLLPGTTLYRYARSDVIAWMESGGQNLGGDGP